MRNGSSIVTGLSSWSSSAATTVSCSSRSKSWGVRSVGVDISANITDLARERGHTAITGAFTPAVAEAIREEHGQADVVTGSNVFAHNADPQTILDAARSVLKPDGVLALEFMYAGDLYEQVQWDTLYHEHLTFYALGTISRLLERTASGRFMPSGSKCTGARYASLPR